MKTDLDHNGSLNLGLVHTTHYLGRDILHPTRTADWFTVLDSKVNHYFVDLRSAMDFVELQWRGRKSKVNNLR